MPDTGRYITRNLKRLNAGKLPMNAGVGFYIL